MKNSKVSHYEKTDDEIVYGIFAKHLGDFDLFISLVTAWVDAKEQIKS